MILDYYTQIEISFILFFIKMREPVIICKNENETRYIYAMLSWISGEILLKKNQKYPVYIAKIDWVFMMRWWVNTQSKEWKSHKFRIIPAKYVSKKSSEDLFD